MLGEWPFGLLEGFRPGGGQTLISSPCPSSPRSPSAFRLSSGVTSSGPRLRPAPHSHTASRVLSLWPPVDLHSQPARWAGSGSPSSFHRRGARLPDAQRLAWVHVPLSRHLPPSQAPSSVCVTVSTSCLRHTHLSVDRARRLALEAGAPFILPLPLAPKLATQSPAPASPGAGSVNSWGSSVLGGSPGAGAGEVRRLEFQPLAPFWLWRLGQVTLPSELQPHHLSQIPRKVKGEGDSKRR